MDILNAFHEPSHTPPSVPVGTDPAATAPVLEEGVLERPTKRKRLLSDKQRAALRGGREKRWKKLHTHEDSEDVNTEKTDPKVAAFLNPNPTPEPSEASDASSVTLGSQDTDTEEEILSKRQLKRAVKKVNKTIPRAVRKRLDRYLRVKLEEQKYALYPEPPALTRQSAYDAKDYSYNGPFSQPLKYL